MTPQERATRLQLEGLEFEASRFSSEFAGADETQEEAEEPTLLEELTDTPIPDDYSLPENREAILRKTQSDLPLVLNAQVIKLINYFSGRGLKTYRATMDRGAAYHEMIDRILDEEEVPRELFHLAQAESGFLPKARSWARATGIWQFVSYRGRQYGLRQDRYVEERYDPEKATRAAARHLKDLYIEFGDWYLAMAAYNSGPERVRRAIRRSGSTDYWTLCQQHLLPRETRNYIPIILAFVYLTKNPQLYDLGQPDPAPALHYDTVTTRTEISLDLLADLTDSTASTLRQLNPALLRSATPPFDYAVRLPQGTAEQFSRELAQVPEDKRLDWRRPAVEEGETLASIAKKYGVEGGKIAELNDLDGNNLPLGTRLTIPAKTKLEVYSGWGPAGGLIEGGTGRYRIGRGDTLGAIAARFGLSVKQLMALNGLSNTRIRAGRYLMVRASSGGRSTHASSTGSRAAFSGRYTVRRGDNLTTIARRFGVSIADLQAGNGLRGGLVNAGQVLRVPGRSEAPEEIAVAAPGDGQYVIRSGDNLDSIAGRFGASVDDLKQWNGLRSSRITAGDTLRVAPAAGSTSVASTREPERPAAAAADRRYRVERGDNLATIARRFDVSVEQLKAWNGLRSSRITAGDELRVGPQQRSSVSARPIPSRTAVTPPSSGSDGQRYRIRRGDNLGAIAQRFNVSVDDLKAWNGLRSNRITAGDYLMIRGDGSSRAAQYRIQRGDTLDAIAKRFGVSVEDLKLWNSLASSQIQEGDYLNIHPETSSNQSPQKLASAGGT